MSEPWLLILSLCTTSKAVLNNGSLDPASRPIASARLRINLTRTWPIGL